MLNNARPYVRAVALFGLWCGLASCGRVGFELQPAAFAGADADLDGGLPSEVGAMPLEAGAMPLEAGAMSLEAGAMPLEAGVMPSEGGAMPSEAGAVVPDAGALDAGSDGSVDGAPIGPGCGDGIVDVEAGETCEPASSTMACPTSCDDSSACTLDVMSGAADTCDVVCTHSEIVEPGNGDGCCPATADANTDSDCAPVCGNGATEVGEQCDGDALCSAQCKRLFDASLVHRYSFDGTGSIAFDSVGGAHGAVINTGLNGSGALRLAGGSSGQFVDLPNGIISSLTDATFEVWFKWNGTTQDHARIFDFGSNPNAEGKQAATATSYFYLTPSYDNDLRLPRVSYTATGSNPTYATSDVMLPTNIVNLAAVFDDTRGRLTLYINGGSPKSVAVNGSLSSLNDINNWLGRSQFMTDPPFDGILYEFRIYAAALDAAAISASFAAGQNPR